MNLNFTNSLLYADNMKIFSNISLMTDCFAKIRAQLGRPRLDEDEPLLETVVNIAMYGSTSHERRQSDVYRSIKTLDQLTEQLIMGDFTISRRGFYLRF